MYANSLACVYVEILVIPLFEVSAEKKRRKWIAVDEKEIKLNGTTVFIWGVVDLDDEKVIAVWVSFGRSGLEAMAFLKKVKLA
jgi:transposase-like protein